MSLISKSDLPTRLSLSNRQRWQTHCKKTFTVPGGDPKPKPQAYQKRRRNESSVSKEKAGPVYNHYANGCGWWDCDREGIDNEEVGLNEVWEGVGSTTLGGIEWH
ncbi:unnamed protein product [Prunus armeniaca]